MHRILATEGPQGAVSKAGIMTRTSAAEAVEGTVSVHPRGFGFLNFSLGRSDQRSAFIAPPELNRFLAGDRVRALVEEGNDGRFSARDLTLVSRGRAVLFGQVLQRKSRLWLQTDKDIANTNWPLQGEAAPDDFVLAQIEGETAVVAEVLDVEADIPLERLIARFDLVEGFDDDCYGEVDSILKTPHSLGRRRDLREVPTITVDAPSTTDLDDAVSVLPADTEGAVRLLISIADPCEFIAQGSSLDEEARARGTSTYLADRVLSMLPHELSSGHLSLSPGEDRCCLTVELRIDIEGEVRAVDIYESLIKSRTRVSYTELDEWLRNGTLSESLGLVQQSLPWFRTAFARLSIARSRRGGVRFESDETRAWLDADGRVGGIASVKTTRAHVLIEHFMVAANEAVAGWLYERGFPALYRVHPEPEREKVELLTNSARQFGFEPGFQGRITPVALAGFDMQVQGVRSEPALRSVIRGVLERASYCSTPGLHLGLGAPLYLHFTSPLRRYADFEVHRIVKAYLRGERSLRPDDASYEELCRHLNHRSTSASKAEAFRRRMLLAEYMAGQVGEIFEARITRVLAFGLVVQLEESLVEGLVALDTLTDGPWTTDSTRAWSADGEYLLGQAVTVKLESAEPELGELLFVVEG